MSFSDGITPETATGIPYMYFTNMEMSVEDINCKNEMSLSMTLAQGDYCNRKGIVLDSVNRKTSNPDFQSNPRIFG